MRLKSHWTIRVKTVHWYLEIGTLNDDENDRKCRKMYTSN